MIVLSGGASVAGLTQSPTKTADYTAGDNEIVPLDTSGGTFTLTGPSTGARFGARWTVGTAAPTIAAPAGYTIAGQASATMGLPPSGTSAEVVVWQAFGTDYQPVSGFKGQTALRSAFDARYPVLDGSSKVPAANSRVYNDRGVVAASTTYNPFDMATYNGRRILFTNTATTGTGTVPFISAANYISLGKINTVSAYDHGYRADGNTATAAANTAALKSAIAVATTIGASVELPPGYGYVAKDGSNPWAVELQSNVYLRGQGMKATQLVLAPNQNCTVIKMHTSTGSGNGNAFYCGVTDMTVDGRKATQDTATGAYHGIDCTTNPLTVGQTGDDGFDAHQFLGNLRIYTCAGDGVHISGRSAIVCFNVFAWQNNGYGFNSSFDTRFESCEAMQSGLAGFRLANGQIQISNSKSYLNGQITPSAGHGFLMQNTNLAVCTMTGSIAQNNVAHGFYFNGAYGWALTGCASDTNNTGNSSYVGWAFDSAAQYNVVVGTTSLTTQAGGTIGYQQNAVSLTGSAVNNDITLTHYAGASQSVGSAVASGSSATGNRVWINGSAVYPIPELASNRGQPNGYAPLDASGLVPTANLPAASGGSTLFFGNGFFGDGSDGTASLDGTNTVTWATKSGSNYFMTQNVNLTSLDVASGVTLRTSGYLLNVKSTLTGSGTLHYNGSTATSSSGGFAATGNYLAGGKVGGAGGTGAGTAGTSQAGQITFGGAGGAAGAGGTGAAGAGGTITALLAAYGGYGLARALPFAAQGWATGNAVSTIAPFAGGAGGGGGGGDATNAGGGGGGGGGVVLVNAKTVAATLTFTANGGNGFTPTTGNAGGGGGGGGGLIIVNTTSVTGGSSPTMTATAGTAGSGVGTGTAGTAGGAGHTYLNVFA